jgi:hypothetical protein
MSAVLALALISLRYTPAICLAPCTVRADITIPRHADNRAWVIQLDGSLFRSSMTPLDGEHAPITQPAIWFNNLPPGDYDLTVVLYRVHGEVSRITRRVVVQ